MGEKLTPLPCPFCGAFGILENEKGSKHWTVTCPDDECFASPLVIVGRSEEQAVERWNTRAGDTSHLALTALRKLAAEVSGLRVFEPEVRLAISNTNWSVLMLRLDEADALLTRTSTNKNGGLRQWLSSSSSC